VDSVPSQEDLVSMDGHNIGAQAGSRGGVAGGGADDEWTVRRLLAWTTTYLRERSVESPRTVVEILLAAVLGVERLRLYMEPDRALSAEELARLRGLVARAGRQEPVQFLVGRWPFFGRDFEVAPCTLIPRPATETLIERALEWYRARGGGDAQVLDLCTGTGCVAISFFLAARAIARPDGAGCRPLEAGRKGAESARSGEAVGGHGGGAAGAGGRSVVFDREGREIEESDGGPRSSDAAGAEPDHPVATEVVEPTASPRRTGTLRIVGTDVIEEAVELARRNAAQLGAGSVEFRAGDLWDAVQDPAFAAFDAVLSNPPYVTDEEFAALDANVREYEPASALRGGRDGLDFVRRIVAGAAGRLRPGGLLAIEVGWKHGAAVRGLFAAGPWHDVRVDRDHEGIERVVSAVRAAE
jgi:release factor glutamine methyltransferase